MVSNLRFYITNAAFALAIALLPAAQSGCNIIGYAAAVADNGTIVQPLYKGLAGQKCGVMVWADDGVVNDYRAIQLDTAKGVEMKLQEAAKAKIEELAGVTWVPPEQIVQYQENHVDLDADAAEEVAPKLGVTRLIYVEVERFQTHPNDSPDLWRGSMIADIKVVEVNGSKATVVYSERGISVVAPRKCPAEGLPNLDDASVYQATLDNFTSAAAERFVPHESDVDDAPPPEDLDVK